MRIVLGVLDVPYVEANGITTGDVAEILEDHYGVMAGFVELHLADIGDDVLAAMDGALENLMMGAPPSSDPLAAAMSDIEQRFRHYLDTEEIVKVGSKNPRFPVPTQAALEGINPRLKSGRGPRRPSFEATGEFYASFRAWTEE